MWSDERDGGMERDGKRTNGRQKENMSSDHSFTVLVQVAAFVCGNGAHQVFTLLCLCITFPRDYLSVLFVFYLEASTKFVPE